MSTTITKIRQRLLADFLPFGEDMRRHGCDDAAVIRAFEHYCEMKRRSFVEKSSEFTRISSCINGLRRDSKIESRLFYVLENNGLKLRFQYEIPPYRVDYLIDDFLVLEIDGPQHDADEARSYDALRDNYLRSHGYHVLRVPVRFVCMCTEAIIEEILEIVLERKARKLPRGGVKKRA